MPLECVASVTLLFNTAEFSNMNKGILLELFCAEFVRLVNDGYDTRFFFLRNRAQDNLNARGQRSSGPFKDEVIILKLRQRHVKVVGKKGMIHCDGTVEGKRPNSGVGTKVHSCG